MHKFNPQHIQKLMSEDRAREIRPESLLRKAGLKRGDVFVDVGCGPGFFTMTGATIVGGAGKVYALDTQQEMLDALKERRPPWFVKSLKSEESTLPITDCEADIALLAYMLHETVDKRGFLREVLRILKTNGRLVIIDWKRIKEDKGPPIEDRLTELDVAVHVRSAGFEKVSVRSLNASHYMILASKP
ncbi:MAG: methyltransferase domain-containing protein [Deltaproteobacteria bacterium]|nr:methyltransferase domain-containing protein [Deltaproteobacteria bacterium]